MKAISIKQPWAWLILHGKDIENRNWYTNIRGTVLIHACRKESFDWDALFFLKENFPDLFWEVAEHFKISKNQYGELPSGEFGGIIGKMDINDCVTECASPWFFGTYGLALKNQKELPFIPCKGSLGFWDVPEDVMKKIEENLHANRL